MSRRVQDARNYTDDRERGHFKEVAGSCYFIITEVRTLRFGACGKKDRLYNFFVRAAISVCERFPKNSEKNRFPNSFEIISYKWYVLIIYYKMNNESMLLTLFKKLIASIGLNEKAIRLNYENFYIY